MISVGSVMSWDSSGLPRHDTNPLIVDRGYRSVQNCRHLYWDEHIVGVPVASVILFFPNFPNVHVLGTAVCVDIKIPAKSKGNFLINGAMIWILFLVTFFKSEHIYRQCVLNTLAFSIKLIKLQAKWKMNQLKVRGAVGLEPSLLRSRFFGGEGCGVCHEAKPNGLLTRDLGGEGSNCFSITKIVGQKRQ